MTDNNENQSLMNLLSKYLILDNPYLFFYSNLFPIMMNKDVVNKLSKYNNENIRYPLIHYFFLLENILFYQHRRVSTYISPILERIKFIMNENNFPDWYLAIHLNSVGYFNFLTNIQPISDNIVNSMRSWKKLYYQIYYNKNKLSFFKYLIDEFFGASRIKNKINIINLSSFIDFIILSLQYSLMSYGTPPESKMFHQKKIINKDNFLDQFKTHSVWNQRFCFGLNNNVELINYYDSNDHEKYFKITIQHNEKYEIYIPVNKICKIIPEFKNLQKFIEDKEFLTYFIKNISKKDIKFEKKSESETVKNIYLEYFKNEDIINY